MRVLLVDHYDSFTYNLAQGLAVAGAEVLVHRHDALGLAEAITLSPTHVVLSPGPGRPEDTVVSTAVLRHFMGRRPVLGVCLGHQLMAQIHGGRIVRVPPVHGRASPVTHDGATLFAGLPDPFDAARYHSLAVDPAALPAGFTVSAWSDDVIMGLRHDPTGAEGVQFHPESILTPAGQRLLANFLGR